jgi:hypothetical protein
MAGGICDQDVRGVTGIKKGGETTGVRSEGDRTVDRTSAEEARSEEDNGVGEVRGAHGVGLGGA